MYLTITTGAQGEFHLQDPFPAEGYCVKKIASSSTVTFPVTVIQLNHLKTQLDAAVKAGIVTTYTFDEADQVPSDELLELRNRTAKVATLAVTGGAVPNLVTLGVRKGDIFNMYVAATGITLSYEVDEVNSATCFTSTVLVVAFDKVAAGDKIYFSRAGVLITGTDRTVAGGITHVIATVSQSPYQRTGFGRFFVKESDGKPYFITSAGVELNLGIALDVLDAVVAVADSASGVATTTGTVQINDLAGAPIAHVVEGLLLAQTAIYVGRNGIQAHVTFSLATAGSILASGNGWCVFKTDATGLFACTMTNANDEGVYFSVCSVDGGTDALAAGAIIRGCIPDLATWIA